MYSTITRCLCRVVSCWAAVRPLSHFGQMLLGTGSTQELPLVDTNFKAHCGGFDHDHIPLFVMSVTRRIKHPPNPILPKFVQLTEATRRYPFQKRAYRDHSNKPLAF